MNDLEKNFAFLGTLAVIGCVGVIFWLIGKLIASS